MKKRLLSTLIIAAMMLSIIPTMTFSMSAAESGKDFIETAGVEFDVDFKMIHVDGGTFTLGWQSSEMGVTAPENTTPVNNVSVDSFYIGETPVTWDLWVSVMGSHPALGPMTKDDLDMFGMITGSDFSNQPVVFIDFYSVHEFLTRLYVMTGKVYRLATEAEWEFAAKGGNPGLAAGHHNYLYAGSNTKSEVVADFGPGSIFGAGPNNVKTKAPNILGIYDLCGNVDEWVYNNWYPSHQGGTNPIGPPGTAFHSQKTRRGGYYEESQPWANFLAARLIRSIDGSDGSLGLRIVLADKDAHGGDPYWVPTEMIRPRDVHHPETGEYLVPQFTYRDPRWITGDHEMWYGALMGYRNDLMKVWETGEMVILTSATATGGGTRRIGQWFTVNNTSLVFVPEGTNNGPRQIIPYVFMDDNMMCVASSAGTIMTAGCPYQRYERQLSINLQYPNIQKPIIANPRSAEQLASEDHTAGNGAYAHTVDTRMWDMDNIPVEAMGQDPRLMDGMDVGWNQGLGAGGLHQYRKDIYGEGQLYNGPNKWVVPDDGGPDAGKELPGGMFYFNVFQGPSDQPGSWNNTLVQGPWFTVNDMFLRVYFATPNTIMDPDGSLGLPIPPDGDYTDPATWANPQYYTLLGGYVDYAYCIVDQGSVPNFTPGGDGAYGLGTLIHVSYVDYERADPRLLTKRPNAPAANAVVYHDFEIPSKPAADVATTAVGTPGVRTLVNSGQSTFRQLPSVGTPCPGIPERLGDSCGLTIDACRCATVDTQSGMHRNNEVLFDFPALLAASKTAAETVLAGMTVTNGTSADEILNVVQGAATHFSIKAAWTTPFSKIEPTPGVPGKITGEIALSMGSESVEVDVDLDTPAIPPDDTDWWKITPRSAYAGVPITMRATDLSADSEGQNLTFVAAAGGTQAHQLIWFGDAGEFWFDRDVRLTRSTPTPTVNITLAAGTVVKVKDGITNPATGVTYPLTDFYVLTTTTNITGGTTTAIRLGFVYDGAPGTRERNRILDDGQFPGIITGPGSSPAPLYTIGTAGVNLKVPATGFAPDAARAATAGTVIDGEVTWSPALHSTGVFMPNTAYTASITVAADNYYGFAQEGFTATVNGKPAAVTGVGNTRIITYTFETTQPEADAIRINTPALVTLRKNNTLQLGVAISPVDATPNIKWSSSNPSVASVDDDGLVTAISFGTVIITATTEYGSLSSIATIRSIA